MPEKHEDLEKQLRAKAEEAICNLLENLPDKSVLTMSDLNPIKWTKRVSPRKVNMKERSHEEKSEEIHR